MQRFPAFRLPTGTGGILEAEGGFLVPEMCILAHAAGARAAGAELHEEEAVLGWEAGDTGDRVRTSHGVYKAAKLVLTAGPRNGKLFPALAPQLEPERHALGLPLRGQPDAVHILARPVFLLGAPSG